MTASNVVPVRTSLPPIDAGDLEPLRLHLGQALLQRRPLGRAGRVGAHGLVLDRRELDDGVRAHAADSSAVKAPARF